MISRLLISAAIALTSCAAPVYAVEPQCSSLENVVTFLLKRGEKPLLSGMDIDGNHISIWINWDSEEWSYVVTDSDSERSCLINYGSNMTPFFIDKGEPV